MSGGLFEGPQFEGELVVELTVAGQPIPADAFAADYVLGFTACPPDARNPRRYWLPVLYYRGKRETRAWSVRLVAARPADHFGRSA